MILKIVQAGHPALRQRARALTPEEVVAPEVQQLVALMRETMRDAPGVGLAAPQVGLALQLAVIEDPREYTERVPAEKLAEYERAPVDFHVIFNPRLTVVDAGPVEFLEGCLSVAGFRALVPRARAVRVEALNERAEPVTIEARGWYARILQHEIDHLHGALYLDRMAPRSFMTEDGHARWWGGRSVADLRKLLDTGRAPPDWR